MHKKRAVTDAFVAANQKNAENSTGPVTDQAKAASALNALKRGLTAKTITAAGNDAEPARTRTLAKRVPA